MRLIGLAILVSLVAAPVGAEAQLTGKVYRVGILWLDAEPSIPPGFDVFQQGLGDSGYVEGTNLSFLHRWSERRPDRLRDQAAELVRLKVDVLLASGTLDRRAPSCPRSRSATADTRFVRSAARECDQQRCADGNLMRFRGLEDRWPLIP